MFLFTTQLSVGGARGKKNKGWRGKESQRKKQMRDKRKGKER